MSISNLTEKRVNNVKEPVISDHLLQCGCLIDFDHFHVLLIFKIRQLFKVNLFIKSDKPVLNHIIKSLQLKLFD